MKRNIMNGLVLMCCIMTGCSDSMQQKKAGSVTAQNIAEIPDRPYSKPIPVDSANKMIQSYLASINVASNPDAIRSLIFDAELLRMYLNDSSNGKIMNMKFIYAHRLSYINEGNFGKRPDSNSNALTLVLIGYGTDGNYIFYNNSYALDFCQPCPRECPDMGSASGDLLSQ